MHRFTGKRYKVTHKRHLLLTLCVCLPPSVCICVCLCLNVWGVSLYVRLCVCTCLCVFWSIKTHRVEEQRPWHKVKIDTRHCAPIQMLLWTVTIRMTWSHHRSCRSHCRKPAVSRASHWTAWTQTPRSWNSLANQDQELPIAPPSQTVHLCWTAPGK